MSDDYEGDDGDALENRPQWRAVPTSFWRSLEGKPAEDDELRDWLATQNEIVIHSHGEFAPENWTGSVDGHNFSFRERHGQWDIEIDHRPSGRHVKQVTGTQLDGTATYRTRELEVGDLIASGTTDAAGYGATTVERAQFIINMVRTHLTRQSCRHYLDKLEAIDILLGVPARWCAYGGAHLPAR